MSFPVMDYKYRSLLLNVPTRHLLNRMKEGDQAIMDHLKLMDRIDLVNWNCQKNPNWVLQMEINNFIKKNNVFHQKKVLYWTVNVLSEFKPVFKFAMLR